MMRFHWPLQRLLDVTDMRALAVKAELFDQSCRIAKGREEIHRREHMLEMMLDDMGQIGIAERMARQETIMKCYYYERNEISKVQCGVDELTVQWEQTRQKLAGLQARIDTLDKLRDEAGKEFRRLEDLQQQQQLDEAYQVTFARKVQNRNKGLLTVK
ncbi:MAG: hypothetical protein K8S55_04450 [Phycisphaerae bacterium]|nr:hypothetical protein [Phycisphaerae bacterium]